MYHNGSVSNYIRYPEICKSEKFSVNIAYYNEDAYFEIVNNTMVKSFYENDPKKDDYERLLVDDYTMIVYDFEILNTFIQNKNVIVNWIETFHIGIINNVTGKWTQLLGKVNN